MFPRVSTNNRPSYGGPDRGKKRMATIGRRLRWWLIPSVLMVAALLFVVGCARHAPQSTITSSSPTQSSIGFVYWLVIGITAAIFIIVEGLLLYAAFRFRRRPGQGRPEQVHGNTRLEIAWTILPAVILLLIAIPTFVVMFRLSRASPADSLRIEVIGHQWWWEARYPDLNVVTANEIHIPAGKPVNITLRSADVIHSFWVPRLAGKVDVIPNRVNRMPTLQADEPGVYEGQCAEFCGESHALMRFKVFADAQNDFDTWVKGMHSAPLAASALGQEGAQLFQQKGCGACHTIAGVSAGTIGPNLTNFGERTTLAAGTLPNDTPSLERWIANPQDVKPGAKMPNLGLSGPEVIRVADYLHGLKPDLNKPLVTPSPGGTPGGSPAPTTGVTPPPVQPGNPDRGRQLITSKGCAGCHTIQGVPGAVGQVGPELTHVASLPNIAGVLSPVNAENLATWLHNPPGVKPGTAMPNLGLSDQEVADLVAFLLTLK